MLALTQKGFSVGEVMALTEPEAASLVNILTEKPDAAGEKSKHYVVRRKPKKAK